MDTSVKECGTCLHVFERIDGPQCGPCEFARGGAPTKWQPFTAPDKIDPDLCVDEGCEHHGTPHVCRTSTPAKGTSDGGATSYYKLPEGATDLQDLIEHKRMSFTRGNIFKATYRLGEKDAATEAYDLNKIIWFAQRRLAELKKTA